MSEVVIRCDISLIRLTHFQFICIVCSLDLVFGGE